MKLNEDIRRIKNLMGINEVLEKLPQDSYLELNTRNIRKFKQELKDLFQSYYDNSGGDYVKFRDSIVQKMDKFSPVLHDYITKDNTFLNSLVSGGGSMLNRGLFDVFKLYNPSENNKSQEKNPCLSSLNQDSIKIVGPITAKTEKDLVSRWVNQPGGRLYRIVLPEECYSQLDPLERASLYVTLEPKQNRIHFPEGIPQKFRGSGLGKMIYLKVLSKLGYITSSLGSSPAAKMMYYDLITDPKYKDKVMGLILQKQLLLIDKNTDLDIKQIFHEFVDGKFTEQKYVEASPDLKNILGQEYTDWYESLGEQNIDDLIQKYKDETPEPGDTVVDIRDGKVYLLGYENVFDAGKPNERTVIWLSGEKYKDKYVNKDEKQNLKVIHKKEK